MPRDLMAAYEYENTFYKGLNIPWGHFTQLFLNRSESYSVPITQLNNYRNTCHLRRVTSLLSGCDFARVHHILTPTQGTTACFAAGKGACGHLESEQRSSGHFGTWANMLLVERRLLP